MESSHASNEKIAEALKLLEEAAREKKADFRSLVSDRYEHLKSALASAEKHTIEGILHAKDVSKEKIKQAGVAVDEHVHANPWPYIGGAAAAAFIFGYLLGRKK